MSNRDVGTQEAVRPIDDVCPWEVVPVTFSSGQTPSFETDSVELYQSSNVLQQQQQQPENLKSQIIEILGKNSQSHLDSCSLSSKVNIVKSTNVFQTIKDTNHTLYQYHHRYHQHQHLVGGTTGTGVIQRNFSVGSAQSTTAKVKLAETSRASVSTCNFSSPQHSFDITHGQRQQLHHQAASISELSISCPIKPAQEEIIEQPQKTQKLSR